MRGLNLTRLARASEGRHFAEEGARQVAKLRKRLSADQLAAAEGAGADPSKNQSVDTVATIAGQAAYRRIAISGARQESLVVSESPVSTLVKRLDNPQESSLAASNLQFSQGESFGPDATVMRALGQGRMAVYQKLRDDGKLARPLPGSDVRSEGAIVGISALVFATGIVAAIGGTGLTYLYLHPSTVDGFREKSLAFRERLETGFFGVGLRRAADALRADGPIISPETSERARTLANQAVGVSVSSNEEPHEEEWGPESPRKSSESSEAIPPAAP